MPKRHYQVDPRILTVFFLVAIPFLAFGALMVMNLARGHMQNVTGPAPRAAGAGGQAARRALRARPVRPPPPALARSAGPGGGDRPPARRRARRAATAGPGLGGRRSGPRGFRRRVTARGPAPRDGPGAAGPAAAPDRGRARAAHRDHDPRRTALERRDALVPRPGGSGDRGQPYVVDIVAPPGAGAMFEIACRDPRPHATGACSGPRARSYDAADLYSVLASVRVGRHRARRPDADLRRPRARLRRELARPQGPLRGVRVHHRRAARAPWLLGHAVREGGRTWTSRRASSGSSPSSRCRACSGRSAWSRTSRRRSPPSRASAGTCS